MSTTVQRRPLAFNDLDEVVRDAEALLAGEYEKAGIWDLGQVAGHVAEWMRYPIDGYPRAPLPIRVLLRVMRATVGKRELRRVLSSGFSAGGPTIRESVPAAGSDAVAAVAKVRESVARLKAHAGPFHPSPLFGYLTKDEWLRLNAVHAAHHLSFLVPRTG